MAKKIKSLKGYDIYRDDNGSYVVIANNHKNDMGPFDSVEEAIRAIEFNKQFSAFGNDCEKPIFTKGTDDADEQWITVKGAHVKVGEGESKGEAVKNFIKKKGGNPAPAKSAGASGKSDEPDEEIQKIKEKWKGKEIKGGHGSEYGDILNYLKKKASKSGELPDMDTYYDLSDKLIEMRRAGKKGTEEYNNLVKQRNDFNKKYNKAHKELEAKAYSLSSESEQKRVGEVKKAFSKKSSDAEKKPFLKMAEIMEDARTKFDDLMSEFGYNDLRRPSEDDDATNKLNPQKMMGKRPNSFEDDRYDLSEQDYKKEYKSLTQKRNAVQPNSPEYKKINQRLMELRGKIKGDPTKDSDPKVDEANKIISLCGGVM